MLDPSLFVMSGVPVNEARHLVHRSGTGKHHVTFKSGCARRSRCAGRLWERVIWRRDAILVSVHQTGAVGRNALPQNVFSNSEIGKKECCFLFLVITKSMPWVTCRRLCPQPTEFIAFAAPGWGEGKAGDRAEGY